MEISTVRFGEIEIQDTEVITFSQGLPGFEQLQQYVIIKPNLELPFSFLQSVEDGEVAFIVVSPFVFYPAYEFDISEDAKQELAIKEETDVLVWNIVSIRDNLEDATINLLAPIIVNNKDLLGKQIILQGTNYTVKQKLISVQQPVVEGGEV
ncbi:flagellar assembly protein FliW [Paenibacillus agricola]|uniref:Flagellar assembly factor FliW n=1 Tax=Paenibacillus agricola TaxID=2716264 RepID=A0ABX0JGP9_9BACL|nr:flagellar assembly protein FliW [Paenibacillus agricola]NHN33868.1 flagellar assembly protein FliW [Paenibacillus agricola]